MKTLIFTFYCMIISIVTSCTITPKDNSKSLPVINLGSVIGKHIPDTFTLNSIAKQVTYIPISTSPDTLFGAANMVHMDKDYYYLVDNRTKTIFRTDKKGKVLNSFSRTGQGPGEYISLGYVHVNSNDSTILVFDHRGDKYVKYDLTGNFIQEYFLKTKGNSDPLFVSDNFIVARTRDKAPYKLCITDNEMNIQQYFFPIDTTLTEMEYLCLLWQLNYCRNRDQAIVNYANEDTVYNINETSINPIFLLRKGEFALSEDEAKKMREFTPEGSPYVQDLRIGCLPEYYLITYMLNNHFYDEIWRKSDNILVSRFSNKDGKWGIPFRLPSGKKIRINTNSMFINANTLAFSISASIAHEEKIANINEEDNPVLVIVDL